MEDADPFSSDYPQRIQLRVLRCGQVIICMHHQLAIAFCGINCMPFRQRREYLGDIMHGVEFTSFFENIDLMEIARTPNHRRHEFFDWIV
jgi:hypothetical protein